MIKVREAVPEDKNGWNDVASKSPSATYAHTWEWKEVIEEGLEIRTLCLVAEDKGEIVGIYPGFLKPIANKPLLKGKYVLFSPLDSTWDYGGPCAISTNLPNEIVNDLVIHMEKIAKIKGAISLRISPFEGETLKTILMERDYRTSARLNSLVDLKNSEKELEQKVRKKWRQYVRKAETNGIQIENVNNEANLKLVYEAILSVHQRENAYLPPYSFFQILFKSFDKNKLWVRAAVFENKIIGGDILFKHRNIVVERYRGVFDDYMGLRPYYLMVWSAIMESKKSGFELYDLGGMPSDEKNGIYFFKSGWGGEIINVDWYVKDVKYQTLKKLKHSMGGK
ncbi:MAG: peptidoglycan bridge formation glycyltransferase FemA/FemB family protein [Euryarchaeota archaeon]|nr:peptidoglycan bridge formation glycyltransferase FemA/FemB family protein [Euryarchaeota archaeon]